MPTAANVVAVGEGNFTFLGTDVCASTIEIQMESEVKPITTTCDYNATTGYINPSDKVTTQRLIFNVTFPWDRTKNPRAWTNGTTGAFTCKLYTGATYTGTAQVQDWSSPGGGIADERTVSIKFVTQSVWTETYA